MTGSFQSMSHSKWDCKCRVVFIPTRRRKAVSGNIRKHPGAIFHELARQKGCAIIEGHLMPDHIHLEAEVSHDGITWVSDGFSVTLHTPDGLHVKADMPRQQQRTWKKGERFRGEPKGTEQSIR